MVSVVTKELGIQVHTVIGGFHLLQTPAEDVRKISSKLHQLGIKQICPTHCTGDESIALIKESFEDGFIAGGTGKIITIQ